MTDLNPEQITILNWNLQKQSSRLLLTELDSLQEVTDVVALQEAVLEPHFLEALRHHDEFSWTPGYRGLKHQTGVLTLTRMAPLEASQHLSHEPWLRTPKAIHITRHAFDGHGQDLLLVNLHAVNFTFGDRAFRDQLALLLPYLDKHQGPTVVTGDFNTWNRARNRCLKDFVEYCRLGEVSFDEDHRKHVLPNPLDHMFIRGLEIDAASTCRTITSDHNPLMARLHVSG